MDCGIAGVYLKKPLSEYPEGGAAFYMYLMLTSLQHRGQQTAGFASFHPQREYSKLDVHKGFGLVNEVFRAMDRSSFRQLMQKYQGAAAIGHVRYATSGLQNGQEARWLEEAQPFHRRHSNKRKHFALVWNGNLANHKELRQELEASGDYEMDTPADTEVLMHYISLGIKDEIEGANQGKRLLDIGKVLKNTTTAFDGSYSIGMLDVGGTLVAFRDPHAFMPLCWGENENVVAFASETKALNKVGIYKHCYIAGGEYLTIDMKQNVRRGQFAEATPTPCFFQWMYFAHPMSTIDSLNVEDFRTSIGKELARLEPQKHALNPKEWVILPIPETSTPIGDAMASSLGVPCVHALVKDSSVRAFIEREEQRSHILATKYNIDPRLINNKNLIVVDDSIVRGDTSLKLIKYIRNAAQPKSIHFRSACPPIVSPCFYGVDFPTLRELAAPQHAQDRLEEELARRLEVDSLRYLPLTSLTRILRECEKEGACKACLTREYPTPAGTKRLEEILTDSG